MTKILYEEFEFITLELLRKISEVEGDTVALMSSDEVFEKTYGRMPQKPVEERVQLALSIEGIGAAIVDGRDVFLPDDCDTEKEFHVGYVPGTYDLLHAGHIENIMFARKCCDQVVVGVNADSLVWKNKKKHTFQTEATRSFVLSHLKGVSLVMVVDTNDKKTVSDRIRQTLGRPIDVIILGEDLMDKDEINRVGLPSGVEIIYTSRPAKVAERRSSTAERLEILALEEQVKRLRSQNTALTKQNAELIERLRLISEQVEDEGD